jgi:hypothetical protein
MALSVPGEQVIIRMWESLEKLGIGLLSPWQIKREGRARAETRRNERLIDARAELELRDILSGQKTLDHRLRLTQATAIDDHKSREGQPVPGTGVTELIEHAQRMKTAEALGHILNLRRIVIFAEAEAESLIPEESTEPGINPDWIAAWREGAQRVSTEELQRLWARVLAGEAQQPGRYSIRTIEFLRAMSKQDAVLISEAARFRIGEAIYTGTVKEPETPFGIGLLANFDLNLAKLMEMESLGVLTGVESSLTYTYDEKRFLMSDNTQYLIFPCNEKIILVEGLIPESTIRLRGLRLTRIGVEIMSLGLFKAHLEYLSALAAEMQGQNPSLSVSICEISSIDGGPAPPSI